MGATCRRSRLVGAWSVSAREAPEAGACTSLSMWRRAWPVRRRLRLLCMSGERARFITEQLRYHTNCNSEFGTPSPLSPRGKAKGSGVLTPDGDAPPSHVSGAVDVFRGGEMRYVGAHAL